MRQMEVLLKTDIPKLGKQGSIIKVSSGYARNYLMPRNMAVTATKENMRLIEVEKKRMLQVEALRKEELAGVARRLESTSCSIETKANEEGHLFGSVTYNIIAEGFHKLGYSVKAEEIELEDASLYPIKSLGIFPIKIKLHADITAKSKVWVVAETNA